MDREEKKEKLWLGRRKGNNWVERRKGKYWKGRGKGKRWERASKGKTWVKRGRNITVGGRIILNREERRMEDVLGRENRRAI